MARIVEASGLGNTLVSSLNRTAILLAFTCEERTPGNEAD